MEFLYRVFINDACKVLILLVALVVSDIQTNETHYCATFQK